MSINIADCFRKTFCVQYMYGTDTDVPAAIRIDEGYVVADTVMPTDELLVTLNESPEVKNTGEVVDRIKELFAEAKAQGYFPSYKQCDTKQPIGFYAISQGSYPTYIEGVVRARLQVLRQRGVHLRRLPTRYQYRTRVGVINNVNSLNALASFARLG